MKQYIIGNLCKVSVCYLVFMCKVAFVLCRPAQSCSRALTTTAAAQVPSHKHIEFPIKCVMQIHAKRFKGVGADPSSRAEIRACHISVQKYVRFCIYFGEI